MPSPPAPGPGHTRARGRWPAPSAGPPSARFYPPARAAAPVPHATRFRPPAVTSSPFSQPVAFTLRVLLDPGRYGSRHPNRPRSGALFYVDAPVSHGHHELPGLAASGCHLTRSAEEERMTQFTYRRTYSSVMRLG